MSNQNKNNGIKFNSNSLLWICIISAPIFIGIYAAINFFLPTSPDWLGFIILGFNALFIAIISIIFKNKQALEEKVKAQSILTENILEKTTISMLKNVDVPCVLTHSDGTIVWCSKGTNDIIGTKDGLIQKNFNDLSPIKMEAFINAINKAKEVEGDNFDHASLPTVINEKNYFANVYERITAQNTYYLFMFDDYTDYANLVKKTEAQSPVVAHIVLDNLDEIAEYVRVNYRSAASDIEGILNKFAEDMHGFIREYNRDKYIMVFSREKYEECAKGKFDILETIRNVRLGDSSVPVTISMGISLVGENFEEMERNAFSALEFALQRGGDQVAVKTDEDILFFGGRTKGVQKKSGSFARVFATQLSSYIANAGNVLIMGHANPDFDSIGACVGAARLCMFCGLKPKIIMNTQHRNFKACSEKLLTLEEYKNIFISAEAGLDMIRSDTLLIIVDANNFNILESSDVANNISNFVVIDHHRKVAEFENEPLLSLIDPSASSASELITGILEQCLPADSMYKEEANLLLSGIMVDTNNFTRTTGTKTFSAAMYLRGVGANSEIAGTFFHEDFDNFLSEAKFNSNVTMYLDRIAITESDGNNPTFDRIAAAKAADKLLTVKGVDASFALVTIENNIHISARSNGSINVQLILEKMGGGGHFDSAAAAISDSDMRSVLYRLKEAIDTYFIEN